MGSLLMPLLGSLAAMAGDVLVTELLRAWGLGKSRRKLERHLAAVQSILLDAEAKSRTDPAVRRWIKDLKTAAYHADDVLDDFRYEALRRHAAKLRRRPTARKVGPRPIFLSCVFNSFYLEMEAFEYLRF
ncbi:unnamed protein product [Triticum turgidum subsp. durum]|uniref:Disease resistance N-terminal domain-containing protein n=1 Tax=Triticum turgidum subsp. durum TaxID=4567 RepID=A0A9R0Z168_TRITD|nr:unnamed protein product [Triticum turgidum subsp. durum]